MRLDELLESVIMRSTKTDLEDWDLDKGAEFSNSGVGSRNSVTALTLTAVLEVLVILCKRYRRMSKQSTCFESLTMFLCVVLAIFPWERLLNRPIDSTT